MTESNIGRRGGLPTGHTPSDNQDKESETDHVPRRAARGDAPQKEVPSSPPDGKATGHAFDTSEALSKGGALASTSDDEYFSDFFEDRDEDAAVAQFKASDTTVNFQNKYNEIDSLIQQKLRALREKYPMGGLKSFQFITTEIILKAPADYFARFEEDAKTVTNSVQSILADKGQAELMSDAVNNPTDENLQDVAFRAIQGNAMEFLDGLSHKGVQKSVLVYMVYTDIIGLSRIEPLWRDRDIDEILINGAFDVQIERKGRLEKVPAVQFRNQQHLENLLERIFGAIGKTLSRTTPILDGRLYDQSRIGVTDRSICPDGPNVAIRRHPEKYWTPMEFVKHDSASEELFTDVGNWIYKGCSYIVIGGTGSGKTSLLNATSGFFHPSQRVLTLEDNLELKMHPNKLLAAALECRSGNPNNLNDRGTTMRDLVKASLRMRPDGIVIGEVRDGAMYDLCQALNTGHWGASSVHANSAYDGIHRMQSLVTQAELVKADAALSLISAGFDFILMQQRFPEDGSRKITMVAEIDAYPTTDNSGRLSLGVTPLWEYETHGVNDAGEVTGEWIKMGDMSEERSKRRFLDLTPDLSWKELTELCTIPEDFVKVH